jgi:beta-lactamase class A
MAGSKLVSRFLEIAEKARLKTIAVAFYDYETSIRFSYQGDRWLHAASTFKAAVLFALLKAAEAGLLDLDDQLHVRNRFASIADGSLYRIQRDRDGDGTIHDRIGRSIRLIDLARTMIVRSSNLATNLLIDHLTLDFIVNTLRDAEVHGVAIRRGVEDLVAHEVGINNEATAEGLLSVFRLFVNENHLSGQYRQTALDILLAQEYNDMLPARLPAGTRTANKTGEISTHCHDAGVIFPEGRKPYVTAIMTEVNPASEDPRRAVADMSAAIFRYIVGTQLDEKHFHE